MSQGRVHTLALKRLRRGIVAMAAVLLLSQSQGCLSSSAAVGRAAGSRLSIASTSCLASAVIEAHSGTGKKDVEFSTTLVRTCVRICFGVPP
jgi:hypothetical protein|eukprot:COSAG01_NODE_1219_length_11174_cov_9.438555_9_plen_92_part_00